MNKHTLYLDHPAESWELGTPIGNGFMGAMLFCDSAHERIQLSHERIWSGKKLDTDIPDFRDRLDKLREILITEPSAADDAAKALLDGAFFRVGSQETAGDILFDITSCGEVTDYRRELDLFSGIGRVTFHSSGEKHLRESFASYPDRVICMRHEGRHSAVISYQRRKSSASINWSKHTSSVSEGEERLYGIDSLIADKDMITVKGHPARDGVPFTVKLRVKTDGELSSDGERIFIDNAVRTELFFAIGVGEEPSFPALDYELLKKRSVEDFEGLMRRAEIDFGEEPSELSEMSVDKRLERLRSDETAVDPGLTALYFDLGRYLLVSSSRPGSLPANLQGVWNTYTEAPWNSDYHTNINLQMNYWHAESANLSECAEPLFDYMNGYLLESGRRTARVNYKCRGTVVHHLSDIYGFTAAADGVWGLWQLGGAWLCYSMWEHYLYTGDTTFLKDTAYEFIHDSVRFFLDYMFELDGCFMTGPSTSPENKYIYNGKRVDLCLSPTMDIEVIGGLLKLYISTEELLSLDSGQEAEARAALSKLPPLKIGKHGQLMEWFEDFEESEPGHRHVSHLFALYPDCAINKDTPELFAAAKRSLERRLSNGGGHTGWSCAWLIALFARLSDGDGAANMLRKLFTVSTLENLLDTHPPFQIDGNFGASAAVVEMLLASHSGRLELLPACTREYSNGSFRGLKIRYGGEVSAAWRDGRVISCEIRAGELPLKTRLSINGEEQTLSLEPCEVYRFG